MGVSRPSTAAATSARSNTAAVVVCIMAVGGDRNARNGHSVCSGDQMRDMGGGGGAATCGSRYASTVVIASRHRSRHVRATRPAGDIQRPGVSRGEGSSDARSVLLLIT